MYKLSPSKAHRFLNCTASLMHDVPFVENAATIRGKLLHEFAEKRLRNEDTREFEINNKINDYEIFIVESYVNSIWREYNEILATQILTEQKQKMTIYDFDIHLVIDALLIGRDTASIIDLKTGRTEVDEEDNEQLLFYGAYVVLKYPDIQNIRLSIHQKGKMRTVNTTPENILDFFIEKERVFDDIRQNRLTYNPSEKACAYCAIKDTCIARAKWILGEKYGKSEI